MRTTAAAVVGPVTRTAAVTVTVVEPRTAAALGPAMRTAAAVVGPVTRTAAVTVTVVGLRTAAALGPAMRTAATTMVVVGFVMGNVAAVVGPVTRTVAMTAAVVKARTAAALGSATRIAIAVVESMVRTAVVVGLGPAAGTATSVGSLTVATIRPPGTRGTSHTHFHVLPQLGGLTDHPTVEAFFFNLGVCM